MNLETGLVSTKIKNHHEKEINLIKKIHQF